MGEVGGVGRPGRCGRPGGRGRRGGTVVVVLESELQDEMLAGGDWEYFRLRDERCGDSVRAAREKSP